jgi:hypothetical protein
VKFRIAPLGFLLSRTWIVLLARPATSTQSPLYALRVLLIHIPLELLTACRLCKIEKSRIESTFSILYSWAKLSELASGSAAATWVGPGNIECCLFSTAGASPQGCR